MDTSSKPTFNPNELSTSQPHDKKRILQFLFVFLGIILIILGLAFWRYVFINRFTTQKPQTSQHESQEIPKEPKEEMNLTSTKLGAFTGPVSRLVSRNVPVLFSKKGNKVAYIIEENRKSSVVINGLTGRAFDQIDDLKISPDGNKVAYVVKDGEYYYVVENAKLSTPYDHIDDLMYSPDGRILKYNAQKEKKEFVVMNGVEGDKYPGISDFIISPDSKRYAYVALDDELKPFVVVDGKKIYPNKPGESPTINDLAFSPDSRHFAYSLSTYINGKSIAYVNVDLKDKKEYDSVREFAFSPDSRHFAYIANLGNVNVDNYTITKEFVVYDEDELYSPDKQNISSILPGRYSLLHQFPEEPVYPLPITFSPLTQSVTYLAFEKHGQYTSLMTQVRDVLHYNFYGLATPIVYSSDGNRIAFGVLQELTGGDQMVEVGREENEIYQRISRPVFSPDSEHLAYVASDSGKDSAAFVILDSVKGETYDEIYSLPTFSQDNNYIGYGARKGDELWWIVDKVSGYGAKVSPSPQSTVTSHNLNGIAIYPGATYVSQTQTDPCKPEDINGYATCGGTLYEWYTFDDYDQVQSWYEEDKGKSGIFCGGGAGFRENERSATGRINCQTDKEYIGSVDMKATATRTKIMIYIPSNKNLQK